VLRLFVIVFAGGRFEPEMPANVDMLKLKKAKARLYVPWR